jgi:hypothetical protein
MPAAHGNAEVWDRDVHHNRPWLVIGTRADGERVVLASAADKYKAEVWQQRFKRHLEGYVRIAVERIAKVAPCERRGGDE